MNDCQAHFPVLFPPRLARVAAALAPAVLFAACAAGCDKKDDGAAVPTLAPSASSLAPSTPVGMAATKFTIDASNKTAIDMPAPIEHIKAETTAAGGSLDVDPMNLGNSRGEVRIDLDTLTTHTFDDKSKDDAQTEHAHKWLEIVEMDAGPTAAQVAQNRWIIFAIRSIDGVSASDLTKIAPTKEGADDVRSATLTAHGEILLHGHKANKDVTLEVRFHYPSGAAPTSKPTGLEIVAKTPLHVVLDEHDVKPRDPLGKLNEKAFSLLGTKVAKTADVTFSLHATPAAT